VNRLHHWLCRSGLWRRAINERFMPWVLQGIDLGEDLLEIGPGPGMTTDLLRVSVERLTAIEIDRKLALSLAARLTGTNVTVVAGDAAKLPFANSSFSTAVSFAMLHHVPSHDLQNTLLQEVRRVLKPGGVFAGMDSGPGLGMRLLHLGDICVPVDPTSFASRLEAAGFRNITVETDRFAFRFHAVAA
jgi:SAM-dependent methyltransferase